MRNPDEGRDANHGSADDPDAEPNRHGKSDRGTAISRPVAAAIVLALVLAAGGAGYWYFVREASRDEAGRPAGATPVTLAQVTSATAETSFHAVGAIVAAESVTLAAPAAGNLAEIAVADGASVTEGALLVRIDDAEQVADVRAARTALQEAELALARTRLLVERDVQPQATLDARRAAYRSAQARLAQAEQALDNRRVYAPFDGTVGIVLVSPGAFVTAGAPLLRIVADAPARVRFSVPVRVAEGLRPGQKVTVRAPTQEAALAAQIEVIEPFAVRASALVDIEAGLAETDAAPKPGSFVSVEVPLERREGALFVPESAVQWAGPRAHVFAVSDDMTARRVPVTLGGRKDGQVEIVAEGIAAGDRVVAEGVQKVRDGSKLRAVAGNAGRQDGAP